MNTTTDLLAAIGRLHPLLLHFPIGLIAGAVGLEIWGVLRRRPESDGATTLLLALAVMSAVAAAACGLLLAQTGGYEGDTVIRHRLFGLGTAAFAIGALLFHSRWKRSRTGWIAALYRLALAGAFVAMIGAGYSGGTLAHGGTPPVEALAAALRAELGYAAPSAPIAAGRDSALQAEAQAILASRCYECHGEEKQKSKLRLDQRQAALAGGKSGVPAIVPGDAMKSRLVEAITLPTGNKRAMPPGGKPRLKPAEVLTLIAWINRGALWPDKYQLYPAGLAPVGAAVLEDLRAEGFRVGPLAQGNPLLRVDSVPAKAKLSALAPAAANVAWLDLSGHHFAAGELHVLADMPHLTHLELQRSDVRDADLADLAKLPSLAVLNLYATQIGDAGLDHLHALGTLERLYLWGTKATPSGVGRLREALPTLQIDTGDTGVGSAQSGTALDQES